MTNKELISLLSAHDPDDDVMVMVSLWETDAEDYPQQAATAEADVAGVSSGGWPTIITSDLSLDI